MLRAVRCFCKEEEHSQWLEELDRLFALWDDQTFDEIMPRAMDLQVTLYDEMDLAMTFQEETGQMQVLLGAIGAILDQRMSNNAPANGKELDS